MQRLIIHSAIAVTRPKFLLLVPACVALGVATAATEVSQVDGLQIAVVFVGAVAAHMAVNALNEYWDFRSGLDHRTERTGFSGGTGTLPAHPEAAPAAAWTGFMMLAIACAAGVYVSLTTGWYVWIPAGIGVLTILLYTGPINRHPVICLLAPGVGFGSCMVTGTHYALTGHCSLPALAASLIPLFLVSNLLLLNQFPDVEADRSVGRRHFPITIGRIASARIFTAFLIAPFVVITVAVALQWLPQGALAGWIAAAPAVRLRAGVAHYADDIRRLEPFMGLNVIVTLAVPALTAAGIWLSR
ncbi:prenyltransferase [bacterium]|nr:prenyltransferase [candidate division CSSED10-310 bacterium]